MNVLWMIAHALAVIPTFPRDINMGVKYLLLRHKINSWSSKGINVHQVFDKVAANHPQKIAIRLEEESWTFKELQDFSIRIANYFSSKNYVKDDPVAVLMENHPRYVATWLGLSRIGVVSALLNTKVKESALVHAVTVATKVPCKAIIVDQDHLKDLKNLPNTMEFFYLGDYPPVTTMNVQHLDPLLEDDNLLRPIDPSISKGITMSSKMVYVYTSGTTGDPKAATFNFKRFIFLAMGIHSLLSLKQKDVLYTPMPLYHTSGGLVGTGQTLLFANTMVTKKRYSKSTYFPDCKRYGVTVAQYIGEMCSYIYTMEKSPADKDHHVRLMFGNGMRRAIWKDFQKRFNIKQIGEFYGSTEGNANMINNNNKVGSIGYIPWFSSLMYPVDLIEYDPETGDPVRKNGLCIKALHKGLLVGKIRNDAGSNFEGYADDKATNKKIIRDVFERGDAYFNSGDVLERDIFNNFYFVDRLGDTFRWKGENIAASQVESIIAKHMDLPPDKIAVYGVKVGSSEGKAGMAAFAVKDDELDKKKLISVVSKQLSKEQTPIFLRVMSDLPKTTTEKVQKTAMSLQGWNPAEYKAKGYDGKLYYYKAADNTAKPPTPPQYLEMTQAVHDKIIRGEISY